ncbi:homoserine dehydrogenase-domain-containing protein [Mycena metata]|uniref:Homoserine dehydrogenase n=1 Tax=Mycena metata TaxID=1033252 RepID=A0AAD7J0Q8_9AGAR|nr:homoserine dehydrogenase-domain-containing protein [Mycena metata]
MASTPKIYVAIVGVGLVGSEFINQLLSIPSSPFHLVSLTSTTRTIFNHSHPISSAWKSDLSASADRPDLHKLTQQLSALVSPTQKVALIDNTSSEDVAALYPTWLSTGISVITPNKKAFSSDVALYDQIVAASRTGGRFLNEATVGAGLPVIGTLKDLVTTGDKRSFGVKMRARSCSLFVPVVATSGGDSHAQQVIKIEGVFSGTMSYIFNEFSTGKADGPAFSSVVKIAREKGYTEPHPADDLNGFDVARKLTILSRIIASPSLPKLQSFASVETASLIPPALENIPTGDEFIARLPEFDAHFAEMRAAASAAGQVLRFVGVVDVVNGRVRAGLEKYPTTHPFATSLGGSDNIIMFHTERYGARPLIVQGAGAGAAVTAMGVLGDLLKLT